MNLAVFVVRRVARLVLSLIAVSIIAFSLLQLAPGSFADISNLAAEESSTVTAEMQQRYGEEVPVWQQYLGFMKGALTWDMGPSYKYTGQNVEDIIATSFPVSATLAVVAVIIALCIAIPVGVFSALRQNTPWDYGSMFAVTIWHSLPPYLVGTFLMLLLSGTWHVLPSRGWSGPENMIMPVIALALGPAAVMTRYVRSSVLETLREEYVTAAFAKGGARRLVIRRYVLRNSLIPLVTVAGPVLANLMTGTVFIEWIFGIPGLGQYFTDAAASRDMPLLMGTTLFFAVILMVTNLVVDLLYGFLDPRIRATAGAR
ncbi:ABC transporter permease [Ruania alkalisoli]|uniref:ABC transporter permease n=1 Tax=Ruania alkalisoli TaxID=2779775 RepID=A0A7M1SRZ0_9MICO|nr:ABC transporter permease [Ruania alkalisoli]QOR70340.1 ABC transporter permease [Ruania alkalisoli]